MLKFTAITRCNKTHKFIYRNNYFVCYFCYGIFKVLLYTNISVGNIPARSLKSLEVLRRVLIYADRNNLFWCHLDGLKSSSMAF